MVQSFTIRLVTALRKDDVMDAVFVKHGEYDRGDAAFPVIAEAVRRFVVMSGRQSIDMSLITPAVIMRTPEKRPVLLLRAMNSDIDVSVTHSGDIWMCLISDGRCGVDFQYMRERDTLKIVNRFFTEGEREYIEGGGTGQFTGSFLRSEEGRTGRFFDIWVRREALGKYEGHGFFGNYPDSAPGGILADSVYLIRKNTEESKRVYVHEITESMLAAAGIKPGAGFRAAYVSESEGPLAIVDLSQA